MLEDFSSVVYNMFCNLLAKFLMKNVGMFYKGHILLKSFIETILLYFSLFFYHTILNKNTA